MGHYKSNLRDIEFNLFEVLGPRRRPGHRPVRRDRRRDRARDPRRGRPARARGPRRVVRGRRPQPAGLRPRDPHRPAARVVQEELPGLDGRRVLAPGHLRRARRHPGPLQPELGDRRAGARRQPRHLDVRRRARRSPASLTATATSATSRSPSYIVDKRLGRHDGADRARRRLRRRRRPHQGHPERRRLLAHRGRQALHHLGRARPEREHHPLRAGPPGRRGRRRPRHQGPVPVHRAEVPLRPRDRRADRRAQRRLRHQRRAQDGHQGLQHLRADLRRPGVAGTRPRAGCSARCTTASPRCSRSSRTPG